MHENLKADLEVDARKKAEAEIKRQHGEIALLKRHIRTVEKIAGATVLRVLAPAPCHLAVENALAMQPSNVSEEPSALITTERLRPSRSWSW